MQSEREARKSGPGWALDAHLPRALMRLDSSLKRWGWGDGC
jgi:hypothetical protein